MSRTAIRRRVDLSDGRLVIRTTIVETAYVERSESRVADGAVATPHGEATPTRERRRRLPMRRRRTRDTDRG